MTGGIRRLDTRRADFPAAFAALLKQGREIQESVDEAAARILDDVADRGDAAVLDCTRRFDRLDLTAETMRVLPGEIAEAAQSCLPQTLDALRLAAARIEAYHRYQLPQDLDHTDEAGVRLGARWRPISAA